MSKQVQVISINEQKVIKQTIMLTIILSVLFVAINYMIQPQFSFSILRFLLGAAIYLIISLVLVVLNEILNLIGYRLRAKVAPESLSLSIYPEKGLIFSKTTEKIKNVHYQSIFLTSFSFSGVIPLAIGFATGSYPLLLASASFIAGGLANFIGIFKLRKYPDDCLVQDLPEQFSVHVYLDEKQASHK
ncbi:hypothetical protein D1B33_10780 [Lysinibacillus yapensis]|uniref:DUF3267 domain-containing protein n=1 Tax=Ureibacillus yapensis TaxID=2304605 RepID=A0A396SCN7_9BACL|nr:metalloprotease family protein [Lysinibacillus yapensis]RHW36118.1 hypothetical protein D1B33_10780 [Lysinibacillus yapensis]